MMNMIVMAVHHGRPYRCHVDLPDFGVIMRRSPVLLPVYRAQGRGISWNGSEHDFSGASGECGCIPAACEAASLRTQGLTIAQ